MAKILSILEQLSLIFAESQEHLSFSQVLLVLQKEKKAGMQGEMPATLSCNSHNLQAVQTLVSII